MCLYFVALCLFSHCAAFPWGKAEGPTLTSFSGDSSHLAETPLLGISLFGEVDRHSGFYELRSLVYCSKAPHLRKNTIFAACT